MINNYITFKEDTHQYFNPEGVEFCSVSKLLKLVENEFDAKNISIGTAKKRDRESKEQAKLLGVSQAEILRGYPKFEQAITPEGVLAEWDAKRESACAVGTRIHNALELYSNTTQVEPKNQKLEPMIKAVNSLFVEYRKVYNEVILHSKKYQIAGTTDKMAQVSMKIENGVIDIADFKTNESRGIEFFSRYGKWYKAPLDHLSECNFNKYAMQKSIYGVMAEEMFGCKVRRLYIVFIPPQNPMEYKIIPVPYLRHEAIALLEYHKEINGIFVKENLQENKNNIISQIPSWD